jgi:hypothetical protein
MSVEDLLTAWRLEPTVGGNFTDWHILPARIPQYLPLPDAIHPQLSAVLRQKGISSLFTHQASAWNPFRLAKTVVVMRARPAERPYVITFRFWIACCVRLKAQPYISFRQKH